jgi:uncharacterized membrane protein
MNFDIAIIGGGPAGYTAAERAGANGLKAVLFEKKAIGGVCLNEGCIPTKTLLYSAKILDSIKNASKYGVFAESPSFDLSKIMSRKDKTVKMLTGGVKMTVNSYGVTIVEKEAFVEGEENGLIRIVCDGEAYFVKQKGEMRVELLHWAESVLKYLVQFGIILLEGTGAVILLFSGVKSVVRLCRNQPHARLSMAQGIALALCFKLGGEVLRTVIVREWSELLVLGAIIFLNAAMSILIHWEIKMEEKRLSAMSDLTD